MSVIDSITTRVSNHFWCNGCNDYHDGEEYRLSYADGEYGASLCRPCLTQLKNLVDGAFLYGPPPLRADIAQRGERHA